MDTCLKIGGHGDKHATNHLPQEKYRPTQTPKRINTAINKFQHDWLHVHPNFAVNLLRILGPVAFALMPTIIESFMGRPCFVVGRIYKSSLPILGFQGLN